jgi:hypothetical protein
MDREYRVAISTDAATGELLAVYFQVRRGIATRVREFADGAALANYNRAGKLLGIELLGPCSVQVVDQIAKKDAAVKKFVRANSPRKMLVAG